MSHCHGTVGSLLVGKFTQCHAVTISRLCRHNITVVSSQYHGCVVTMALLGRHNVDINQCRHCDAVLQFLGVWYSHYKQYSSWDTVVHNFEKDNKGQVILYYSGEE